MPTRLAIRIQECLDDLTPSERTLASYILDNQHLVLGLSATELARAAGTSKSTTVRFFRTLGYEGYDAVRLQAREELNRLQPGGEVGEPVPRSKVGSPEAFLVEEKTALSRTLEAFGSETLRAAIDRLAAAERIWIAAFDEDAVLGPLAHGLLLSVRGNVNLLNDGISSIYGKLVSIGPRDTLVLIALSHRSPEAKFAVEQAQDGGANLVVLTNLSLSSPLGSDVVVRCHAQSVMPDGSVTSAVSVLQLITRQLAARLGARAANRKALLSGLREAARNRG